MNISESSGQDKNNTIAIVVVGAAVNVATCLGFVPQFQRWRLIILFRKGLSNQNIYELPYWSTSTFTFLERSNQPYFQAQTFAFMNNFLASPLMLFPTEYIRVFKRSEGSITLKSSPLCLKQPWFISHGAWLSGRPWTNSSRKACCQVLHTAPNWKIRPWIVFHVLWSCQLWNDLYINSLRLWFRPSI